MISRNWRVNTVNSVNNVNNVNTVNIMRIREDLYRSALLAFFKNIIAMLPLDSHAGRVMSFFQLPIIASGTRRRAKLETDGWFR